MKTKLLKCLAFLIKCVIIFLLFAGQAAIYEQTMHIIGNQHVLLEAIQGTQV